MGNYTLLIALLVVISIKSTLAGGKFNPFLFQFMMQQRQQQLQQQQQQPQPQYPTGNKYPIETTSQPTTTSTTASTTTTTTTTESKTTEETAKPIKTTAINNDTTTVKPLKLVLGDNDPQLGYGSQSYYYSGQMNYPPYGDYSNPYDYNGYNAFNTPTSTKFLQETSPQVGNAYDTTTSRSQLPERSTPNSSNSLKPIKLGPPTPPRAPIPQFQWGGFPLLPTRPPMDFQLDFSMGPSTTSGPDWVNVPVNQQPYFPPQQQAAGGVGGMGMGGMGVGGMGGGGMGMHRGLHGR